MTNCNAEVDMEIWQQNKEIFNSKNLYLQKG